jgi:hypothetical protein
MPSQKYYSFVEYSGIDESRFYDFFINRDNTAIILYYPEYYRSMAVKLYNFDNKGSGGSPVTIIKYEERGDKKYIIESKVVKSYDEALSYVKEGKYKIGGTNPYASPIPVYIMDNYKLVYNSTYSVRKESVLGFVPEIKIFESIESNIRWQPKTKI